MIDDAAMLSDKRAKSILEAKEVGKCTKYIPISSKGPSKQQRGLDLGPTCEGP